MLRRTDPGAQLHWPSGESKDSAYRRSLCIVTSLTTGRKAMEIRRITMRPAFTRTFT